MTTKLEKLKKDLIKRFSEEVENCGSVDSIVLLLYRYPGCGHQCSISDPIMDVLGKYGIDEDAYFRTVDKYSTPV